MNSTASDVVRLRQLVGNILKQHAGDLPRPAQWLTVPRKEWWSDSQTIAILADFVLPKTKGSTLVVVEGIRGTPVEAILWIENLVAACVNVGFDVPRHAHLVTAYRILWRTPPRQRKVIEVAMDDSNTSWTDSGSGLSLPDLPAIEVNTPTMGIEDHIAAYTQLLADADLLLMVERAPFHLIPLMFLNDVVSHWQSHPIWRNPIRDIQHAYMQEHGTVHWLALEHILAHFKHTASAIAAQATRHQRALSPVSTLEWVAATELIPWNATITADDFKSTSVDGDQGVVPRELYDMWVLPYRHVRSLTAALRSMQKQRRTTSQSTRPEPPSRTIDDHLALASPPLAEAVKRKLTEVIPRSGPSPSSNKAKYDKELDPAIGLGILRETREIRRHVANLTELAEYLPPCMAAVRKQGLQTKHLKYWDRFLSASFFASIGQELGAPMNAGVALNMRKDAAIDEITRFMVGRGMDDPDVADYVVTLRSMLSRTTHGIMPCSYIREERGRPGVKTGDGSAMACPYANGGYCMRANDLSSRSNTPLFFPGNWTRLAVRKAGVY